MGRVADVAETGFIDGTLVIPQFVLKELQLVADSRLDESEPLAPRGSDILQRIQEMSGVEVMIPMSTSSCSATFPISFKRIELARSVQGNIVTNHFNLTRSL